MTSSYLQRLRVRRDTLALKRQIVLGLVGGWLLLVEGSFRYLYVIPARNGTCLALLATGGLLFLAGLLRPALLAPIERVARLASSFIGKAVFGIVLTLAYFLIVTPVGLVWGRTRGRVPFFAWTGAPPAGLEGWSPKQVIDDVRGAESTAKRSPLLLQPFFILSYFFRYGHLAMIPLLLFLLLSGLILFFVKSSALAPFIYSLF